MLKMHGEFVKIYGESNKGAVVRVWFTLITRMSTKHHMSILLRSARAKLGLTQRELAGLLGITAVCLCRYEKGYRLPPFTVLLKLKKLLGGTPQDALVHLI